MVSESTNTLNQCGLIPFSPIKQDTAVPHTDRGRGGGCQGEGRGCSTGLLFQPTITPHHIAPTHAQHHIWWHEHSPMTEQSIIITDYVRYCRHITHALRNIWLLLTKVRMYIRTYMCHCVDTGQCVIAMNSVHTTYVPTDCTYSTYTYVLQACASIM